MGTCTGIRQILREFYSRLKGKVSASVQAGDSSPVSGGGVYNAIQGAKPVIAVELAEGEAKTNVGATPVLWNIEARKDGYTPLSITLVANNSADTLFGIESQTMQSGYAQASGFVSKRMNDGTLSKWKPSLLIVWMRN